MKYIGLIAIFPFLGMFLGPVFHNSATPFILGMPFILGWIVVWILVAAVTMGLIYWLDPVRHASDAQGDAR